MVTSTVTVTKIHPRNVVLQSLPRPQCSQWPKTGAPTQTYRPGNQAETQAKTNQLFQLRKTSAQKATYLKAPRSFTGIKKSK